MLLIHIENVFFDKNAKGLATARAGNVIGGGDFSANRLISDLIKAIINNHTLQIRNPNATRPWQHLTLYTATCCSDECL